MPSDSGGISVVVPYRSECPWRARAWSWIRDRYLDLHPSWELIEATCDGEAWSKGAAVADGVEHATGDRLVIADADSFVDVETMDLAVQLLDTHPWIVPHRRVRRLARKATEAVFAGAPPNPQRLCRSVYTGVIGGGITVLRRSAYEEAGGIDTRFAGWGGEDISFGWALETLVGPPERLTADLFHLWHPHAAPRLRGSPESEALAGRYRRARNDPVAMRQLVDEARGSHVR